MEEDTKKWEGILYSWIGRINLVRKAILPKAIYKFNAIPIQISMAFFTKISSDLYGTTRPQIAKDILREK